jgi:catechol 2,3-dioxygenase-like lactoylglutathione lyase family enzyme
VSRYEVLELPGPAIANPAGVLGGIELNHVGIVVHDLDAAVGRYRELFGVGDWTKISWESEVRWRGELVDTAGVAALAGFGPIRIELAQPTKGRFLMSDWLERRGEGVFHFGYLVPDVAAVVARAERAGWTVELLCDSDEGLEYAYLDPQPAGGVCVELVSERLLGATDDSSNRDI